MNFDNIIVNVLVVVMFLGGVAVGLLSAVPEINFYKEYNTLIEECQKSLPRDQICTLIAIPVEED
jgi:hypothetical protein